MGALTKKERDALDDVFSSLCIANDKYERFREFFILLKKRKKRLFKKSRRHR